MIKNAIHCGVVLLVLTAGCGDGRLKKLSVGIDRDSVAVVMQADQPLKSESYIVDGKVWDVLYYSNGSAAEGDDSIATRKLSPVIMADGKVAGWGWDYWEREAPKLKVQLPPK